VGREVARELVLGAAELIGGVVVSQASGADTAELISDLRDAVTSEAALARP
jgi:hypothetical protein